MTQQTGIGYRRRLAMAMSLAWPDNSVSRSTLAAVLPPGDTAKPALTHFLSWCYVRQWASGGAGFVRIREPGSLRKYALGGQPPTTSWRDFIHVPSVATTVRRQLAFEPNPAVRRLRQAEIEMLQRLL